jgi:putative sigma-54 modulation protein
MTIEYTGRHTSITAKLKAQAEAGMVRIDRVTNRCTSAHVILTEDKYRNIAEITVKCRGEELVATCEATEMETALHDALQKVEQQAVRHKQKFETVRQHPKPIPVPSL